MSLEKRGVDIAHELNHEIEIDGKKYQIELCVADAKSDKVESANCATRVIESDKVCAIIGPSNSGTNMAIAEIVREAEVPTIASTATGIDLFKAIVNNSGVVDNKYAKNGMFWAMNHKTYTKLMAESLSINAAGAIVAGANKEMPVVGGAVEELNFMPDNVIIGGYGELYLLAERQGGEFAQSEHARFTDDQTVFKGTARYDGLPVIAAGFVAIGLAGVTPSASGITFAEDSANPS